MRLFRTLPTRLIKCLVCHKNVVFIKYLMEYYAHIDAIRQSLKDLAELCTLPGFPNRPFILGLARRKVFEMDKL